MGTYDILYLYKCLFKIFVEKGDFESFICLYCGGGKIGMPSWYYVLSTVVSIAYCLFSNEIWVVLSL